ncbi:MAG: RdgB/HAM1 family non-canonical purine NTP pyrophosphatase [Parvularcula sp.]
MPSLMGKSVVLASHNEGKLKEFAAALAGDPVTLTSARGLGLDEPEETGVSFAENALIKARAVAQQTGQPALADDSGLAVSALGGAPGIYSARWAGPEKDFGAAMARVEQELAAAGTSDFSAAFVCVLAVAWPEGEVVTAEGRIEGQLRFPPAGGGGFGYDPIFVPEGEERTFGQMSPEEKSLYSHRMRALAALRPKVL